MIASLFSVLALIAQDPAQSSRDCRDDNGVDRCEAENRAEVLRSLGMRSIDEEQAAGAEVYRALQIDGYGNVMAGVSFIRRAGAAPEVVVNGRDGQSMTAPLSPAVWAQVQADAPLAARELAPLPDSNALSGLCFHAWVSTVEVANPANRGKPKPGHWRRTQGACGDGLTSRFAFNLVGLALKAFPVCDALDPDDHRNDAARLKTCVDFRGDRLAAVDLMNQTGWRAVPDENADQQLTWLRAFGGAGDVKLDWAGERVDGQDRFRNNPVAEFLIRRRAEAPSLRGYIRTFNGVSSTRAETEGFMSMDGPDERPLSAPFRQVWLWDENGLSWKLESWTVEPFTASR